MNQINKNRINRFRKAYPEMEDVEDVYILRLINKNKEAKRLVDLRLKERIGELSAQM